MDIRKLTKEQAIIISGFTGILCGEFYDFHADVEKRLGRGVQTFEFGIKSFITEVKKLYEADFIELATVDKEPAKAQAVPEWISTSERMPPVDETVLVCWDYAPDIEPEKEYTTIDENLDEYWPNCQDEPPTHWMPLPKVIKAQEQKVTEMKIAWGTGCPKCNHNEATIHSTAEQDSGYEFMDGDEVVCLKCGNKGEMDADGENSDILWNEDEAQEPPMTEIEFNQTGNFSAVNAARDWLRDHGYSYGSMCGDMPIGILKGDWCIAKWRNLTPKERNQLDGKLISSDFRNGPVVIKLKDHASDEEIKAGSRIKQGANQ